MYSDIEYLEEFVYDSKLKDIKVFSKQYFNSIIYSMYKSNPDKLVCFTFGDFNKLSQINKNYSNQAGDYAIKTALGLIKNNLPPDTIIARIAGDEFGFISFNTHKQDMDKNFQNIDTILKENSENIYGLTITTSSIDSSLYQDFDDMYIHSELDVTKKKKINSKKQYENPEALLSDTIYKGLSNYFSYYRLEVEALPKDYYPLLRDGIIDIVINKLEKPNRQMSSFMEDLKKTLPTDTDFEANRLELPTSFATQIHNYITDNKMESIPENAEFRKLFKFLITDPLTGECSKNFFDTSIIPMFKENSHRDISVRLFDLTHLKLSNDIIGHNKTDDKINELFGKIVSQIKDENNSNKYFASAGNCGLLLIENADSAIPDDKMNMFIKNALQNQKILDIVTARRTCNPSDITKTISHLKKDCSIEKKKYKLRKINSNETILPLELALNDSLNCYIKNTNNPYSLKNKQAFVIKIFENLTKVISEQFPSQSDNIFRD